MNVVDDIMIEAEGLTKAYGARKAIDDISFHCRKGEIVGLLGPNGAGKTTTMRILTGYMPPTSGDAYIAGHHTVNQSLQARHVLGYLPETVPLYSEMSVEDYLAYIGRLRRVDNVWERVDASLASVGLLDRAESYIGKLSKGMRQRVGLAQALIHDPSVLILDEPTIGLDPAQIVEVRSLIAKLGQDRTLLISTHILSEVEQICNRVIMIINGRIWADMPLNQSTFSGSERLINIQLAAPQPDSAERLAGVPGVTDVLPAGDGRFSLAFDGRDETRTQVAETAVSSGWGLLELMVKRSTLEDLFMSKLREAELAATQGLVVDQEEVVDQATVEAVDGQEEE